MNNKINKINKNLGNKKLLIYLALAVLMLAIAGFVIGLSPQEEISQLESELNDAGYSWLVEHNLNRGSLYIGLTNKYIELTNNYAELKW